MAGPTTRVNYVSDSGPTYAILVPTWQQAVTGDVAATSTVKKPSGLIRRHRMLRDPATGREIKITVGAVTSAAWTAGMLVTVTPAPVVPGRPGVAWQYAGRIGERDLIRG